MGKLLLRQCLHVRVDEQRHTDGAQKNYDQVRNLRKAARAQGSYAPGAELEGE
jgi:hypothetical protein